MVNECSRSSLGRSLNRLRSTISNSLKRSSHPSKALFPTPGAQSASESDDSEGFVPRESVSIGLNNDTASAALAPQSRPSFGKDGHTHCSLSSSCSFSQCNGPCAHAGSARLHPKITPSAHSSSSLAPKEHSHSSKRHMDTRHPFTHNFKHNSTLAAHDHTLVNKRTGVDKEMVANKGVGVIVDDEAVMFEDMSSYGWYIGFQKEFGPLLGKKEVDTICREYMTRHGPDFLEIGLRSYLNSIVETRQFRLRCYQVLARNPTINPTRNRTSNYYYTTTSRISGSTNNIAATTSNPAGSSVDINDVEINRNETDLFQTPVSRIQTHSIPLHTTTTTNNEFVSTPMKSSPFKSSRFKHSRSNSNASKTNIATATIANNDDVDIDEFINKYEYLNSDKNSSDSVNNNTGRNSSNGNDNNASTVLNEQVLTYDEKLKLLEKIGIEDDYIAKRICTKFNRINSNLSQDLFISINSGTIATNGNISCTNTTSNTTTNSSGNSMDLKKNLEDFNMFYKDNLKSQLDLNQCISQEIIHISNASTPIKPLHPVTSTSGSTASVGNSNINDEVGSSLFRRISNTIDRNKDSGPLNILSLTHY